VEAAKLVELCALLELSAEAWEELSPDQQAAGKKGGARRRTPQKLSS
jgi:hypothetical protein